MEVLNTIKQNRQQLIDGYINCIPNPFNGMKKYFSGIFPGALVCVTAETSVGKTSLAKYLYVFSVADYILSLNNPSDLDYTCYWFGLEESVEEFDISVIQYALAKYYNVNKTQDELLSRIKELDDNTIKLIESTKVQDYFNLVKKSSVAAVFMPVICSVALGTCPALAVACGTLIQSNVETSPARQPAHW
jgi:hypothetical protein